MLAVRICFKTKYCEFRKKDFNFINTEKEFIICLNIESGNFRRYSSG